MNTDSSWAVWMRNTINLIARRAIKLISSWNPDTRLEHLHQADSLVIWIREDIFTSARQSGCRWASSSWNLCCTPSWDLINRVKDPRIFHLVDKKLGVGTAPIPEDAHMAYTGLVDDKQYDHRICGLHKNLAKTIRTIHEHDDNTRDYEYVKQKLQIRLYAETLCESFGAIFGSASQDYHVSATKQEDVRINWFRAFWWS